VLICPEIYKTSIIADLKLLSALIVATTEETPEEIPAEA
jgi:hypothetical protein